jgi:uroporphyrinogen-III synthase
VPEVAPSPLAGKRVVITRALAQSQELTQRLSERGALPILFPLVSFAPPDDFTPLDAGLRRLGDFDWLIFTSENAVHAIAERLASQDLSFEKTGIPRQVAAVGPATARAAEKAGFIVAFAAKSHSGAALANELGEAVRGSKIFLPRSDRANPDLPALLRQHGAQVTEAVAYKTLPPPDLDRSDLVSITSGSADAILFFSPTAVEHFVQWIGEEKFRNLQKDVAIVAVGPITAAALQKLQIARIVVAVDTTCDAVLEALRRHFSDSEKHSTAGVHPV